ncbi:MAG TPA: bifunctional nicotinamidase/pyrazinamidase [Kofleriaceae bacterium]
MRALLLIDLQYDFCPGGALAVARGDDTIPVANRLMPRFSTIIATQDWHPHDHGSFASNHPVAKPYDLGELAGLPQVMWPAHCVQGTRGADLHDHLDRNLITEVFRKGTDPAIDSYSGFFDNGHRKSTGLGDWLKQRDIKQLFVLGLATDYCVKFTTLDARQLGFEVTLVVDGCRGVNLNPADSDKAIAEMRDAGATIVDSSAVS